VDERGLILGPGGGGACLWRLLAKKPILNRRGGGGSTGPYRFGGRKKLKDSQGEREGGLKISRKKGIKYAGAEEGAQNEEEVTGKIPKLKKIGESRVFLP